MEVEVTAIPPLGPGELALVDLHSVLHLATLLQTELAVIGLNLAGSPGLLARSLAFCREQVAVLSDPARAGDLADRVAEYEQLVLEEIVAASTAYPLKAQQSDQRETVDNVRHLFRLFAARARELRARLQAPDAWVCFPFAALRPDLLEVLSAREKLTHGRQRVMCGPAGPISPESGAELLLHSLNGVSLSLPLLALDVVRDLLANARKYSAPGGVVTLNLRETAAELRCLVQDGGCGIAPEDLPVVAGFGCRGGNVRPTLSLGGGYGLTKAFLVAKRFGGRLWLNSAPGAGTTVTLVLPRLATV